MQKLVFINGTGSQIDLTAGNFGITNWAGLSNTGLNIQTQQVPFEDGGVFLDALMDQREIELTVAIRDDNDLSVRYQKKRELISALNPKLGEGTLIYTNDYLSRQIKAVPKIPLFENKNSNDAGTLKASVVFSCCSPYWEDVEEMEIVINADEIKIIENKGDIPCQLNIDLFNIDSENLLVKNITEDKSILINGVYDEVVNINTGIGNKKVVEKKFNSEISYIAPNVVCGCYDESNNEFVLAGNEIIIKTKDFKSFNVYSTSYNISKIYFFPETNKFVATTSNSTIYSYDGINWSSTNVYYKLSNVFYLNGKYYGSVANGNDTIIYQSEDLATWTSSTVTGIYLNKIIYAEDLSLFVGIGVASIYTSSDLETWNLRLNLAVSYNSFKDIFYIKGGNIVVASEYQLNYGEYILRCFYSADGIDWNTASMANYHISGDCSISGSKGKGFYIKYGSSLFNSILGESWQYIKSFNGSNITYFKELGDFLVFSPISSVLTNAVQIKSVSSITDFIYNEKIKKYIIIGGRNIYTSEDKINWELVYNAGFNLKQIIYVDDFDKYFITTTDYDQIYVGSDLRNLELRSYTTGVPYPNEIKYIPQLKKLFIVGISGGTTPDQNGRIRFTSDGETWEGGFIADRNPRNISSVAYTDKYNRLVFTALNTVTYYSEDGGSTLQEYQTYTPYMKMLYIKNMEKIFTCNSSSENGSYWLRLNNLELQNFDYSEDSSIFIGYKNNNCFMSFNCQEWLQLNLSLEDLTEIVQIKYIKKDKTFYIVGIISGNYCLIELKLEESTNIINKLDSNSDMTLNLKIGINNLKISCSEGSIVGVIKYRQKYIGV